MSADTVASEFVCFSDKPEVISYEHPICFTKIDFPRRSNLQTILTALFDHAHECEKERNPKPKKRRPPSDGSW